jgi:hypothetical protein
LAGYPPSGITYEDEATLGSNTTADFTDNQDPALDLAKNHKTKIILLHGTADGAIRWRHDVDYYRHVATWNGDGNVDFEKLQEWFRLFPMPGVGHGTGSAGGGPGPSPVDPFLALVKWVERGIAPDTLLAQGGAGAPATRTRRLCPFPTTAMYHGKGSSDDASSFSCGGNLETKEVVCNDLRTTYKHENGDELDFANTGVGEGKCKVSKPDDDDSD